ncbi:MAG: NAD(P)-binding domain-containing protein [Chloroflexi bacterium]|nr:NAD(P)-binding domain-containing protein [Chloroflexota bacterium]
MTSQDPIPFATTRKPRIAILGTGNMALALGKSLLAAGHFVGFGSRRPETKNDFHDAVGHESRIWGYQAAIDAGEIVIITLPYKDVAATARKFADSLRKKIVIDITNPFAAQPNNGESGAQVTASIIGEGARVVAAFKTNFAATFENPIDSTGEPREVHYAGDDEKAMTAVAELISGIGFKPVDCGTLAQAVVLDHMVPLMIRLDTTELDAQHLSSFRITPG